MKAHGQPVATEATRQPARPRVLTSPITFALVLTALVASLLTGTSQAQTVDDDIIVINEETPSNEQITARLSRLTADDASVAIVASSDNRSYADSLASAGLQNLGPLLLVDDVEPGAELPNLVATELLRLEVDRVLVLGGEAAVSAATIDAIELAGYDVQRVAGPSRIETAIEVARLGSAGADTALLVRAFGNDEATDPTQGWVDALSSGPLAIEQQAPILLTQQDALSPATSDYLEESGITEIVIIGGAAAVSEGVETQLLGLGYAVFRIAGSDRVQTTLSVNAARGVLESPARSVVVDGFAVNGWVGGFASARHAAETRAAVLPAQGDGFPAGVTSLLQSNPVYEARPVTCIVQIDVCRQIRPGIQEDGPVDTPTDTPTTEPTAEPNTQAVVLNSTPGAGAILSPLEGLNLEIIEAIIEERCEQEESPVQCSDDLRVELIDNAAIPIASDQAPLNAIRITLDDPLRELQNAVSVSGGCIAGKNIAMPESEVTVGVIDTRPAFYLEAQNGEPLPEADEPVLTDDPSGLCLVQVTSPLVPDGDAAPDAAGEDFTETIAFEYDAYLANFRVATIPNAPAGQVSFQDDSWGLDNEYSWDFGDGSPLSTERSPTHTYDNSNEYIVTLTITAASRGEGDEPNQTSISRIVEVES